MSEGDLEIVEVCTEDGYFLAAGPLVAGEVRAPVYAAGPAAQFVVRGCRWPLDSPVFLAEGSVLVLRISFSDSRTGERLAWPEVARRIDDALAVIPRPSGPCRASRRRPRPGPS